VISVKNSVSLAPGISWAIQSLLDQCCWSIPQSQSGPQDGSRSGIGSELSVGHHPPSGANPFSGLSDDPHGNLITMGSEVHASDSADRHLVTKAGSTRVEDTRDVTDRIIARSVNHTSVVDDPCRVRTTPPGRLTVRSTTPPVAFNVRVGASAVLPYSDLDGLQLWPGRNQFGCTFDFLDGALPYLRSSSGRTTIGFKPRFSCPLNPGSMEMTVSVFRRRGWMWMELMGAKDYSVTPPQNVIRSRNFEAPCAKGEHTYWAAASFLVVAPDGRFSMASYQSRRVRLKC
jgi:hypothetical protein